MQDVNQRAHRWLRAGVALAKTCPREQSLACPSLATLHGGVFAATVHVARDSLTTVHGGKFSLASLQPGASD